MGRYLGPVCKLCRREGEKLFLKGNRCVSDKCALSRRKLPPGDKKIKEEEENSSLNMENN